MRAVGYGMVTAGSILWGFNGPISRMALDAGIEPRQLAGWRVLSAAILITGVLILLRRVRFRCSRRALLSMAAFGVFGISMPQWLYYEAISRFDVGLTLVIVYTAPLWVAGIHRVTRGTRQPRQVSAAMALALVGVAIAVLGGGGLGSGSLLGLVLAIATSLAYTTQLVLTDRLDPSLPASSRLAVSMIFGGVFWLLLPAVRDLPTELLQSDVPFGTLDFTVPMMALIAYVVIGGTILPYALLVGGVSRIGPVAAGVTGMIEPIVAITLGWALLGQELSAAPGPRDRAGAGVRAGQRARAQPRARRPLGLRTGQQPVDVVVVVVAVRIDPEAADDRADVDADAAAALELGHRVVAAQRDHAGSLGRLERRQDVVAAAPLLQALERARRPAAPTGRRCSRCRRRAAARCRPWRPPARAATGRPSS